MHPKTHRIICTHHATLTHKDPDASQRGCVIVIMHLSDDASQQCITILMHCITAIHHYGFRHFRQYFNLLRRISNKCIRSEIRLSEHTKISLIMTRIERLQTATPV